MAVTTVAIATVTLSMASIAFLVAYLTGIALGGTIALGTAISRLSMAIRGRVMSIRGLLIAVRGSVMAIRGFLIAVRGRVMAVGRSMVTVRGGMMTIRLLFRVAALGRRLIVVSDNKVSLRFSFSISISRLVRISNDDTATGVRMALMAVIAVCMAMMTVAVAVAWSLPSLRNSSDS